MRYINAKIDDGGKLSCTLEEYITIEGEPKTYPLIQNSANYYTFRLISNNLPDEWKDILLAKNNRWVVFQNTKMPSNKNTAAVPLEEVTEKGVLYLQAIIPPYVLYAPGYLSITIIFTLNENGKSLSTVSQNESDTAPLRILPANNSLDKAILDGLSIEDKTLYHRLIGMLMGGTTGQVLMKDAESGALGYTWVSGTSLTDGMYYGGTVSQVTMYEVSGNLSENKNFIVATVADTAISKLIPSAYQGSNLVILENTAAPNTIKTLKKNESDKTGIDYPVLGWQACKNAQFLAVGGFTFADPNTSPSAATINVAINDYLTSDGEKWFNIPAIDPAIISNIIQANYVPWDYSGETKTLDNIDISGTAGKVKHSLRIGELVYDGSTEQSVESINGSWLTDKTVSKDKLADDVNDVYIPWSYGGGSTTAVKINIDGNAKTATTATTANKVANSFSIAGKSYNGSEVVSVSAEELATTLDETTKEYIDTVNVKNKAIKSEKIDDKTITNAQIADGTIENEKIMNGTISYIKMDKASMASRLLRIKTGNTVPNDPNNPVGADECELYVQWFE